ncbi:MAG: IS630 family transposase [Bacteroidetes bacterium]|nr:IS630 family transposase [Bacteroidota bacterium]
MIFIDESGTKLGETSSYGYSQSGERVSSPEPKNKGNNISIVSAICSTGVLAAMFCNCTFNSAAFECFIEKYLLAHLKPGNILVLDNVSFHKSPLIVKALSDMGVSIVFLPPYSPELNPIENMWSKIKNYLRRLKIKKMTCFERGLKKALESVTADDCSGWFSHCGYI